MSKQNGTTNEEKIKDEKIKKIIKVNDLESAKQLVVESISDYQQGLKTEKECKNLGYLVQVLTTLERAILDESRINKIIDFELIKHANDISVQFEVFLDAVTKLVGKDKIEAILEEYRSRLSNMDEITENTRRDLFEKMHKFASIRLEPDFNQEIENTVEYIKYSLDRIPMDSRDKVAYYMLTKNYLKKYKLVYREN